MSQLAVQNARAELAQWQQQQALKGNAVTAIESAEMMKELTITQLTEQLVETDGLSEIQAREIASEIEATCDHNKPQVPGQGPDYPYLNTPEFHQHMQEVNNHEDAAEKQAFSDAKEIVDGLDPDVVSHDPALRNLQDPNYVEAEKARRHEKWEQMISERKQSDPEIHQKLEGARQRTKEIMNSTRREMEADGTKLTEVQWNQVKAESYDIAYDELGLSEFKEANPYIKMPVDKLGQTLPNSKVLDNARANAAQKVQERSSQAPAAKASNTTQQPTNVAPREPSPLPEGPVDNKQAPGHSTTRNDSVKAFNDAQQRQEQYQQQLGQDAAYNAQNKS